MAEYGPLDAIRDQVRWIRRRRNLLALQRGIYPIVGTAAALGSVVLFALLRAGPAIFALSLLLAAAGLAAAIPPALRRGRRTWLSASVAPLWADRHAGLAERISTALAVGPRRGDAFARLLVADTAARVRLLRPERLVPRVVPWPEFAGAAGGLGLLAAVAFFVPAPVPPPIVFVAGSSQNEPVRPTAAAPRAGRPLAAEPGAARRAAPEPQAGRTGPRERLPAAGILGVATAVQRWLREALRRAGDTALARWSVPAKPPTGPGRAGPEGAATDPLTATTLPDPEQLGPSAPESGVDARVIGSTGPTAEHGTAGATGGPGAGSGTDPQLYGPSRRIDGRGGGRFELAIAARVFARPGGGQDSAKEEPVPEPEAAPAPAGAQRADTPPHRLIVPPSWRPVVRRLFAHETAVQPADEAP